MWCLVVSKPSSSFCRKKKPKRRKGVANCSKLGLITCGQRHRRSEWFTKLFSDDPEVWMIYTLTTSNQTGLNWKCRSLVWIWVIPVLHVDSHEATNAVEATRFPWQQKDYCYLEEVTGRDLPRSWSYVSKQGLSSFDQWRGGRWESREPTHMEATLVSCSGKVSGAWGENTLAWKCFFLLVVNFTFC